MTPLAPTWHETLSRYRPHDGTVADLLASRAEPDPRRPFLLHDGRVASWAEIAEATARAAAWLAGRGVSRGDRIAVIAPNRDRTIVLFFAVARLGAILVPVNPELRPAEAGFILDHAAPAGVLTVPETRAVAAAACAGAWIADLDELGAGGPAGPLPAPGAVVADDVCLILYTSGTTGFPKGVMHAQRTFGLAGEGFVERMALVPDDRLLCVLPLFHVNALFYSLGGAVAAGASLVLAPRFSASGFWRLCAATGATEVNVIAAVGTILARRPRSEYVAGHALRKVYGAPVPPEVAEVFRRDFGVLQVIEGYGMTEIPGAASVPWDGPPLPGSLGTAARHPQAELRVVDEDGRDLPDRLAGELLVRTPLVMKGYYRDPEATAAAFSDGGWFATGDLVRREPGGALYFVARKKDIIRRRGENVSGAELDRVLGQHPRIAEAAAIPVPAELGEDEILVVVVPRPGAALTAPQVAPICAERLAAHKVPRYVVFAAELPHTPTHRVAKFKLRADPALLGRAVDLARTP
jgi:crotonobetaine/carnitine-CoA ligase